MKHNDLLLLAQAELAAAQLAATVTSALQQKHRERPLQAQPAVAAAQLLGTLLCVRERVLALKVMVFGPPRPPAVGAVTRTA